MLKGARFGVGEMPWWVGVGVYGVGWWCGARRACKAAQVFEVSQSVVDEVVDVVMACWRVPDRGVKVCGRWRVQALMK